MDFQTWVSTTCCRIFFQERSRLMLLLCRLDEGRWIDPLAFLVEELPRLFDEDLPVVWRDGDGRALERSRRRALEVDARAIVARAVARTLEFVLGGEPVRNAAEVGADGDERVNHLRVAHDPDLVLLLPALVHLADLVVGRVARLEGRRRLEEDVRKKETRHRGDERTHTGGEREPADREPAQETAARGGNRRDSRDRDLR